MQKSANNTTFITLLMLISSLTAPAPLLAEGLPAITYLPRLQIDDSRAKLGQRLFFDKRLSANETTACADCHRPKQGYTLHQPLSPGGQASGYFRNIPGLINTVHKSSWGWDGRHANLTDMIGEMFSSPTTMNMDPLLMEERMRQDTSYVDLFAAAGYPAISGQHAHTAVAEYLKRLTSKNAPVDTGTLSQAARRGKQLFEDKAGCIRCHYGAMLSDGKSHNLGVAANPQIFEQPDNHQALLAYASQHKLPHSMELSDDPGRYAITQNPRDQNAYITPSLRELSKTGPYMHNGSLQTPADVVEFYFFGGGSHGGKSPLLQPLDITFEEMNDLIAFLESLTGRDLSSDLYVWSEGYPANYSSIRYWTDTARQGGMRQ